MLILRPYAPRDAASITDWCKDEYAFRQWSADRYPIFPITPDEMNRYYCEHQKDGALFVLTALEGTQVAGHLTLRFPEARRDELRLGFVILDPQRRGKGLGKELLKLATRYAFTHFPVAKLTLGVFENNTAAIRCYKSCGFAPVPTETAEHYICMGERWNCIEMELTREKAAAILEKDVSL